MTASNRTEEISSQFNLLQGEWVTEAHFASREREGTEEGRIEANPAEEIRK